MHNPDIPPIPVRSPMKRFGEHPILTCKDMPYRSTLVFNPGVARWNGRYVMLIRNDVSPGWGDCNFEYTEDALAWSDDGIHWEIEPKPAISVGDAKRMLAPFFPRGGEDEVVAVYDPRITVLDGRAYIGVGISSKFGMQGGILVTDDFHHYEALCVVAPNNRDVVLFPEKINGLYVRFERPMNDGAKAESNPGKFGIYVSQSPDLRFWDSPRRILASDEIPFANERIGAGPPPIKTREGWLTIFHTVHSDPKRGKNGWDDKWQNRYDTAVMLLDLDDPTRIRACAKVPLLQPDAPYENYDGKTFETSGFRGGVVFPTGAVVDDDGTLKLFYGAADSFVALATAKLDDVVRFCLDASGPLPG